MKIESVAYLVLISFSSYNPSIFSLIQTFSNLVNPDHCPQLDELELQAMLPNGTLENQNVTENNSMTAIHRVECLPGYRFTGATAEENANLEPFVRCELEQIWSFSHPGLNCSFCIRRFVFLISSEPAGNSQSLKNSTTYSNPNLLSTFHL